MKSKSQITAFTKKQILGSKTFDRTQKDLLSALLSSSEKYTLEQVHTLLEKEMKRGVK